MENNKKKIFIIVFILVGAIMVGLYLYNNNLKNKNIPGEKNIIEKFNPFGSSTKVNNTGETTTVNENNPDGELGDNLVEDYSRFYQVTSFAVSGAAFLNDKREIPTTSEPVVDMAPTDTKTPPKATFEMVPSLRYVEKSTGHIYQMYLDTKIEGKISNSTIPNVYETIFSKSANSIIYRYYSSENKSITSFLATLGGSMSKFLNTNIKEVSLSPDKNKFFSITSNSKGAIGTVSSFEETKTNQVFASSFSEWLPQWVTEQNIYLTTKPSYEVLGSVYNLNLKNGSLSKIFGNVLGLTTLANNSGTHILFGSSSSTGPRLNIFDIKNNKSTDLNKYGLPDKCIWSSDNINIYCAIPNTIIGIQYPDNWYQGVVSFEDRFVKIDTSTNEIYSLSNSKDYTPVDATHLFLSDKEDQLYFINKKDYTLWSLDI